MREIIIDTETTGLDIISGHRIDMPTEAYRIHGISGEFLKNKPMFNYVAIEFLQFIADSKLVIYNTQFEVS